MTQVCTSPSLLLTKHHERTECSKQRQIPCVTPNYERMGLLKFCLFSCFLVVLFLSYSWYQYHSNIRYMPSVPYKEKPCRNDDRTNNSRFDKPQELKVQRIVYDKPSALNPKRTDIAVITPWLAPIIWNGMYNIDILNAQFHQRGARIGLTVFAVKKYIIFIKTFIETAEQYFMVGHKVNYYVFTDRANEIPPISLKEGRRLMVLNVPNYKRWQDITMGRMTMIRDNAQKYFINEVDYLVCVDVDMVFTDAVGVEILSDVFGTLHPWFFRESRNGFTYERRPESKAYIPADEGDFYFAGGFFGGTVEEVYKLTTYCHNAMMADSEKSIEAAWQDESYLNKYFLYHKPTKVLSPEYLWDKNVGSFTFLQKSRFVAIPKNYDQIRNKR